MSDLIENIVNEKNAKIFVEDNFKNKLDILKELRDELINLMFRCLTSKKESERDIKDLVILCILLKYTISMLDSIIILVSEGAILSSFLPIRTLFEIKLYIEWILKDDSLSRAKHFFVGNKRAQIFLLNRLIKGTRENISFTNLLENVEIKENSEIQAQKAVSDIKKLLADNDFKEINNSFDKLKEKDKYKREPKWYKLSGCKSIWEMAYKLSMTGDYEFVYTDISSIVHPTNMNYQININGNHIDFEPIRHPIHIGEVLSYSMGYTLTIYMKLLQEYRPDEVDQFRRKYIVKWQKEFMNMPTIKSETIEINLDNI